MSQKYGEAAELGRNEVQAAQCRLFGTRVVNRRDLSMSKIVKPMPGEAVMYNITDFEFPLRTTQEASTDAALLERKNKMMSCGAVL